PYSGLKHGHPANHSTLWVINELCNIDKHRLLLGMIHSVNTDDLGWWGLPEGVESPGFWYNLAPLEIGDVVARFDFHGAPAPADFDPHISLAVALDEGPAGHWIRLRKVDELLSGLLAGLVLHINWPFVTHFFPGEPPIVLS